MYRFNATIHAAGACDSSHSAEQSKTPLRSTVGLRGQELNTLQLSIPELYTPFACTFEQTAGALDKHDRVHFEPDGSFVWGEGVGDERWQIDGHLFDRDGHLLYMHLKGNCPLEVFDQMLLAVGWPKQTLRMQLQPEGYILDEENFRIFAASEKA